MQCKRWFYNAKILNLKGKEDTRYARRGNVVHECLEFYYQSREGVELNPFNLNSNDSKRIATEELFNQKWIEFGLDKDFNEKKTETLKMIYTGMRLNLDVTHCEHEFRFYDPDYIGFADVVNTKTHQIGDYKSSSYNSTFAKKQYEKQMKYYAWAYHKKFGVIPLCNVYYLGANVTIPFRFNVLELTEIDAEMRDINKYIEIHTKIEDYPEHCTTRMDAPMFCPYKDLCFPNRSVSHFKIDLGSSEIRIIYPYSDVPKLLIYQLDKKFSFEDINSEYIKEATNWDGVTHFYNKSRHTLPIGFLPEVLKTLSDWCEYSGEIFSYDILKTRYAENHAKMPDKLNDIELRPYQVEAVDKIIKNKIGCLHISVGGGKTEIACEIIRRVKRKTLWLTHKIELLNQSKARIEKRLGISVGVWSGNTCDLEHDVVIATVQTISNRINKSKPFISLLSICFDVVIVDECHHAISKTWNRVLKVCGAEYRIGLSGSLNENPKNMYIWSQLGYIIHEINSEELIEQEYLAMPEIRMITIHNYDVLGTWPEVREEFIIHNEIRNNEIRVICIEDTGFVVIIVNLIEHGELLQKIIPDSEFINGELDKPTREKIMHDAREGKLKVLIGTVINEGIDLPNIDTIILAGGGKSDIQTIQSAGRVLRKNGLKTKTIIDFYDTGKYLREHSNERKKVYEKYGKVIII